MFYCSLYSRSTALKIDMSPARQRGINPHFGVIRNLGQTALCEAHVLAVDEYVNVAADVVLIVEHTLADCGIVAAQGHECLADRHPHVGRQPHLDNLSVAGKSTERGWQVKEHRETQATSTAFTHSTAGSQSAIEFQLSPSSRDANSWPLR